MNIDKASEADDAATIAQAHAATEAAIAEEDELAKRSFSGRLEAFLREQPDVADVEEVADGIFGFRLAGLGEMSLQYNVTP